MTSVTRSITHQHEHEHEQRRMNTIMGYYDNEPQAGETVTIEEPIDQLQAADAIADDLDGDLGDGIKAVRERPRGYGW